jgi:hypothetical protein
MHDNPYYQPLNPQNANDIASMGVLSQGAKDELDKIANDLNNPGSTVKSININTTGYYYIDRNEDVTPKEQNNNAVICK